MAPAPRRRPARIGKLEVIDYKDVDTLKKFLTEGGKILPRRLTGLAARRGLGRSPRVSPPR